MAVSNNLTKFNSLLEGIINDDKIQEQALDAHEKGIKPGDVAYARIINTILTQSNVVTYALAQVIAEHLQSSDGALGLTDGATVTSAKVKKALRKLADDILNENWKNVTRAKNTFYSGPVSGGNVAGQFRELDPDDIPSLDAGKITTGEFLAARIASNAVETTKIKDKNVTTAKLADTSVTTAKIANANVTEAKLADDSVTTDKIKDLNVTTDKLGNTSVTEGKVASDAITTNKIKDKNVTNDKIADDTITNAKIASNAAIAMSKLGNGKVTVEEGTNHLKIRIVSALPSTPAADTLYFII